ncbi:glycosyltransferase [bacterium]|nr:glycosyltransferase [bacterium]
MRITLVAPVYPLRGGIAQYAGILYQELRKKGHDIQIVNFKRQYPKLLFPGKTQTETSDEPIIIESKIIIDSINPFTWFQAYREIKKFRTELVIFKYWMPFFGPCLGVIARLSRRFAHSKIMMICDNILPHEKRIGDITLTHFILNSTDLFITQSDTVKKDLLSLKPAAQYRNTPHPIYNIFGPQIQKKAAKAELKISSDRVILFFGFIRKYKGLDILLRAMPIVLKQIDVQLLVAGEFYDSEQEYRDLIKELKLENHVTVYADYCPNEKVGQFFCASDAVVLPYRSATQSGIVQIAYHFNKPVIVTDVGGLAEVVLDHITGFITPPNDPERIAESILKFYAEHRETEFTKNIETEKKKYTWETFVEVLEDLAGVQRL